MRHRKAGNKLNRSTSHRKAALSNMATAVVVHKRIKTTLAKAREASRVVDRMITFGKKGTLAARREVLKTIRDKEVVKTLFDEVAPQYADRNGGYTRIIKLGRRVGDGASVAYLELVGFENVITAKNKAKDKAKGAEEYDFATSRYQPGGDDLTMDYDDDSLGTKTKDLPLKRPKLPEEKMDSDVETEVIKVIKKKRKKKKYEMGICGSCGEYIPITSNSCPECGATFSQEGEELGVCGNCGETIPASADECPYCGARFE